MTIGQQIQQLRQEYGLSATEMARRCESTHKSIFRWEREREKPNSKKIIKLNAAFGISADDLLETAGEYTDENLDLSIGEKIRILRSGKTWSEFRGGCWVTTEAILRIENGVTQNIHADTLTDLCAMTGMSVDWLLGIRRK